MTSVDYIIVGAGSAGCVMANRLAKDHSVLLLEAGPKDHALDFRLHMPAALSHVLSNDTYNWYYESEPEPALNNRPMYCPRGRVLGGSSSINGMIFIRGHEQDFERWAKAPGLEDWCYEKCLPFFKRSESAKSAASEWRGQDGPMKVAHGDISNPLFQAWFAAADELGIPSTNDFNGPQQEGLGPFDRTILNGQRLSTAKAYLDPVKHLENLKVETGVRVRKVLIDKTKAHGVEVLRQGKLERYYANIEVILCGGAINSPQLLMLSGIGSAAELKQVDINAVVDLPGVGKNLMDHLELYVQYECKQPVSIYPNLKWYRQPWVGLNWYLFRQGAGATNHFEAGGFLKSSEAVDYPDLQFHFLPVAMNYDGRHKFEGHGFQVHVGPMKPTSRGHVRLGSADPMANPIIKFNYNSTEQDQSVMRAGIRRVREIVAAKAFDELRGREIQPGLGAQSDAELDEFIKAHAESAYHPSGTCKMGEDELAVTNAAGLVHGIEGLRVVDASLMPEVTNGNLNAPVIMMAEKIAAGILA